MTGLPDLVLDLQNDAKLTFLLRSEKINMAPLSMTDITLSYQRVFDYSFAEAGKMAKMTMGYSYAFQLLGYLVFENLSNTAFNGQAVKDVQPAYQALLLKIPIKKFSLIFQHWIDNT